MSSKYPITIDESVMNRKAHGTCERPVMENLRWGSDWKTADKICCFNRHYAEHSGYFLSTKVRLLFLKTSVILVGRKYTSNEIGNGLLSPLVHVF